MKKFVAALVLAMAFHQVYAANDKDEYVIHGHGKHSCDEFVNHKSSLFTQTYYFVWLQGYVSHYNKVTAETVDIWQDMDFNGAILWIENFCRNHPLEDVHAAAIALIDELYPKRIQ